MKQVSITIFISQMNEKNERAITELRNQLNEHFSDNYQLEVVNVLQMPEKALEQGIFVTPTLVRNIPEPVLKVLGDLSNMRAALTKIDLIGLGDDEVVII